MELRRAADSANTRDVVSAGPPAQSRADNSLLGYGYAAAGALLFSTKSIVIKLAYDAGANAELMQALRMVIALPIYLTIGLQSLAALRRIGKPAPGHRSLLVAAGVGLLGYWVSSYLDLKGLEFISAQQERLVLFTYPFFVVLFGAVFFGQTLTRRALLAFSVSYVGLALTFAPNVSVADDALLGAALVLVSAMTFAVYQLLAKRVVTTMGPRIFTCVAMSAASGASLLQFALQHPVLQPALSFHVWLLGFVFAVAGTVLPSFLLNAALQSISARANAVIGTLSPILTIILAFAILGEALTPLSMAGGALVIAGVAWFSLMDYRSA